MMNPTDLADATAKALDLLPNHDPARSDPRLVRQANLVEEARLTKDTAAAVWLAISPLRTAPPEVIRSVMAEIHPAQSHGGREPRPFGLVLAASGWAAAAVIAILLWPKASVLRPPSVPSSPSSVAVRAEASNSAAPQAMPEHKFRAREEIGRLQKRLASLRNDPAYQSPRVIPLNAPGGISRTPEEACQRVQKILTEALRSTLEAEGGAAQDGVSLVIERGWLPGGLPVLEDGELIRHRHFPEEDWQELGLSRSPDGSYYDAASGSIWEPDPEGRGFIGRKISEDDDLTQFTQQPGERTIEPKSLAAPEGFLVENSVDGTTDIIVENVPTLAAGGQFVVQTLSSGSVIKEIPLIVGSSAGFIPGSMTAGTINVQKDGITGVPFNLKGHVPTGVVSGPRPSGAGVSTSLSGGLLVPSANGVSYTSNIVGYVDSGSVILSFPSGTIPEGFQLIERATGDTGRPDKVIVTSQP